MTEGSRTGRRAAKVGSRGNACRGKIGAETAVDQGDLFFGRILFSLFSLFEVRVAGENKGDGFGGTLGGGTKGTSRKRSYTGRWMGENGAGSWMEKKLYREDFLKGNESCAL